MIDQSLPHRVPTSFVVTMYLYIMYRPKNLFKVMIKFGVYHN